MTNEQQMNPNKRLRLLYLKEIFEEESDRTHGISISEIKAHLQERTIFADRRTLYDDIHFLQRMYNLPIRHEDGERLYYLEDHYFTLAELKLIIDSIISSKTLTYEDTQHLTDKLSKFCSKHQRSELARSIYMNDRLKSTNRLVTTSIDFLHDAISRHKWVAFRYFHYNTNLKKVFHYGGRQCRVEPAALLIINDFYYLLAYDKRHRRKLFRIDRMQHVEIHSENTNINPVRLEEDIDRLTTSAFTLEDETEKALVKIRFSNNCIDDVIDRFGLDIPIVPDGPYHFVLTYFVEVSPDFFSWIFSFDQNAEILEPASVRRRMVWMINRIKRNYKDVK